MVLLKRSKAMIKLKKGMRVAITQSNADVLKKISKVLQKYNIHSKIYGPYEHRNSKKQMYYLHIEKDNVQKFFNSST